MKYIFAILFFLLPAISYAQQNTVQVRSLISRLDDSTEFLYNLSYIQLRPISGERYIDFAPAVDSNYTDWLKTVPFLGDGNSDTLSFMRYFNYSNTKYATGVDAHNTLTTDPTLFPSSANVKYILEMRRASDDSVLYALDTVNCYVNTKGKLRYTTTNNSPVIRMLRRTIPANTPVYLVTRIVNGLPHTTRITNVVGSSYEGSTQILRMAWLYGVHQDRYAIQPSHDQQEWSDSLNPTRATVRWNKKSSSIDITMNVRLADIYTFEVRDQRQQLLSTETKEIPEGDNRIALAAPAYSGTYTVSFSSKYRKEIHKVKIQK